MSSPAISIVIVTWNCRDLVADCLESVSRYAGDVSHEILVIDNASADDTLEMLAQAYPKVRVIANDENLGFGRASNKGMAEARAPLFCLLNPDTIFTEPDTLLRVVQRMRDFPGIGAAGCRLVFPDGIHQVGDAGDPPTIGSVLSHAFFLSKFAPRRFPGLFLQEGRIEPPFGHVGWVCGACTVVRRSVFEQIGGFDESYFLYGEDVEWGCRMTQRGVFVAYFPDIRIVHVQGGTQKDKLVPSTRWIDGIARLYFDFNQGRNWWLFRASMALGFLLRSLIYQVRPGMHSAMEMRTYARFIWKLRPPQDSFPAPE